VDQRTILVEQERTAKTTSSLAKREVPFPGGTMAGHESAIRRTQQLPFLPRTGAAATDSKVMPRD
jgi:hypothetical protein